MSANSHKLHLIPEYALNPSDDFVTGGIRRFVKINDPGTDILLEVAL